MSTISAFPLQWPAGWKRTPASQQVAGRFGKRSVGTLGWKQLKEVSVAEAVARARAELGRMKIGEADIVVSTNLKLRLDGWPRSDQAEPQDSGAAVYWNDRDDTTRCMAIDRYRRVADNLAAIGATLEAMRAIERHGGAEILDRAFTGFTALPSSTESWWGVLGVEPDATPAEIHMAYKRERSKHHPDRGGDADKFHAVQAAYVESDVEAST